MRLEGSEKVAKLLIECGANISGLDASGNTLLHQYVENRDLTATPSEVIVKALIDKGLDVNAPNNNGDTPLHLTKNGRF